MSLHHPTGTGAGTAEYQWVRAGGVSTQDAVPGWHHTFCVRAIRVPGQACGVGPSAARRPGERYLIRRLEEIRQTSIYGVRPTRTFDEAAAKFVRENQHKRSLKDDIGRFRQLLPWIGGLHLHHVGMSSLQGWIDSRRKDGVRPGTINHGLKVVRRISRGKARSASHARVRLQWQTGAADVERSMASSATARGAASGAGA